MKITPRTLLAALAYTGARRLTSLARKLAPGLPESIYVTGDLWCYLPEHKHLVLTRSSCPEMVIAITRHAGITTVIQPGGSIKDDLSIAACDARGMAMYTTGIRHFKH